MSSQIRITTFCKALNSAVFGLNTYSFTAVSHSLLPYIWLIFLVFVTCLASLGIWTSVSKLEEIESITNVYNQMYNFLSVFMCMLCVFSYSKWQTKASDIYISLDIYWWIYVYINAMFPGSIFVFKIVCIWLNWKLKTKWILGCFGC